MTDASLSIIVASVAACITGSLAAIPGIITALRQGRIEKKVQDSATVVGDIHKAVNSERTAMIAMVKELRDQILELSKSNASMVERQRGKEVAVEVAAATAAAQDKQETKPGSTTT